VFENKERERRGKNKGGFLNLKNVVSPSLFSHDVRLGPFQVHTGLPVKSCEPGIHDGDGACGLPRA
jgi:hypothetical protein